MATRIMQEIRSHDTTNVLTNVTLGLLRGGKGRPLLFQLCLQVIKFFIRQSGFSLQVGLNGSKILCLLTVHGDSGRAIPCKVLLQEIKLFIIEELSSTDIIGLHIDALCEM